MRDEFSRLHPIIGFVYFAVVIIFGALYMNPVLLGISLCTALIYAAYLGGRRFLRFALGAVAPIALFAALINAAFNHNGLTVLCYLPTGNPLTAESLIYGICAAALLSGVIMWFFCMNRVITSDKFIYLFGRIIPSLSLILSMILRYIPRLRQQYAHISGAQRSLLRADGGGIRNKLRHGLNVFSIMITWSLEGAIVTADSMTSRGYGLRGRTAFSRYRFYRRDGALLALLLVLAALQILLTVLGCAEVEFYPYYEVRFTPVGLCGYVNFGLICILPMIINLTEDIKWNYFRSKI